jgi:TolB-like protein/Tfp pilus assembly protein PilF
VNKPSFLAELKRRNVLRAGMLYAAGAWLLVQVATQVFPFFNIPNWVVRWIVIAAAIGFPFAMVLSWFYEFTPEGLKAESELATHPAMVRSTGKALDRWIIVVLSLAVVLLLANTFVLHRDATSGSDKTAAATRDKSIAVLPFENLSSDKDNAYFAAGMQDEILTRLSKIGTLRVISRTSTLPFASHPENLPEIATKLGVANILEGSVQRVGNKVRINVQLIQANGDSHLWSDTYDRNLDDVFTVQGEVAGAIADHLGAALNGDAKREVAAVPTRNGAALDAYLRGVTLTYQGFSDSDAVPALHALQQAVKADPGFAQAWAALTALDTRMIWIGWDSSPERRAECLHALETAERLQPDTLDTLYARAVYVATVQLDMVDARKLLEDLHTRWPNDVHTLRALSNTIRDIGDWEQADDLLQQAIRLDPLNAGIYRTIAVNKTNERRFDVALAAADRALALVPGDEETRQIQGDVYLAQGDLVRAAQVLDKLPAILSDECHQYVVLARMQRRPGPAIAWLRGLLELADASTPPIEIGNGYLDLGDLQQLNGDHVAAVASYQRARELMQPLVEREPDNDWAFGVLTYARIGMGEGDAALAAMRQRQAERPEAKGATDNDLIREFRARVLARLGHKTEAIAELRYLLGIHYGGLMPPLTPAFLRLDPDFDRLRDDPEFQKLAAGAVAAPAVSSGAKP